VTWWRWLVATLALFLLSTSAVAQAEHVVLVSIDGLSAYTLEDQTLELPNIRHLISEGVWAESSETVYPSVTHPAHTTLVTGVDPVVHGVVGNTLVDRVTGERFHITNKPHKESVRVRTLFDAANKGLSTAAFFWPETKLDPSIDYNIPEVFDERGSAAREAADPAFLEELRAAGIPIDLYYDWYLETPRKGATDAVLADAAAYVLKRYRPSLLAIHLLVTDDVQHEYGAEHYLAKAAFTAADYAVGILLRGIEEAGIAARTSVFIVSDHGFQTVRHEVNVYPLFERHGLLDRVRLHPGDWGVSVELNDRFQPERDGEALERVFSEAVALEGIARVLRPEDFDRLGFPRYEADTRVRGQYTILGEIDTFAVVDPENASTERRLRSEPFHGHGYLPTNPKMYTSFVAAGPGIRRGVRIGHIRNHDVAPTIARILDLDLPGTSGRVLVELFE
jgi:predicted AlkP superfamily pyrophosphatase or phosphodiesterase